jgi:hypothetical protein
MMQRLSPPTYFFYFPCRGFFLCTEKALTLPALKLLLSKDLFALTELEFVTLADLKFLALTDFEFLALTDLELAEI